MLEVNPSIADPVFRNSFVSGLEKEGMYDVDGIYEIIENTMKEYGDFSNNHPIHQIYFPNRKKNYRSMLKISGS